MSEAKPDHYQLQAAISALHAIAPDWQSTDWQQIHQLYAVMYKLKPSPIVALNKYVALANCGQLENAYSQLLTLEQDLKNYQPFYAAKAELSQQLGQTHAAIENYEIALSLTNNGAEKVFLSTKLNYSKTFSKKT